MLRIVYNSHEEVFFIILLVFCIYIVSAVLNNEQRIRMLELMTGFVINVVKSDPDFNGLPLTIKANGQEKEEQAQQPAAGESQSTVLKEIVREMTTTCKAAGLTKKIILEIRAGNPADDIINISNLMHFDLIIMGSRRIDSKIEVIGSTTRKFITKAKTPLLIVHKQPTYKDEY
jgi:nucleotide-binding universal stress UspA family protein